MNKPTRHWLFVAVAIAALVGGYVLHATTGRGAIDIRPLMAVPMPDLEGKSRRVGDWAGKILVVNFWATWCPPCLEEMPELSRLQEKYRDRDVVVLGISTDELDKIREFAKEHPVSYPLLAGNVEAMDLGISLGNDKGVLPYTAIIKADGTIAKTYFGQVDQALLEQTLLPLIKAKTKL